MDHPVQWVTASPLWNDLIGAGDPAGLAAFRQPGLLRFATDTFMEDFLALTQTDPSRLKTLVVRSETWRSLAPLPVPVTPPPRFALSLNRLRLARSRNGAAAAAPVIPPAAGPLKLYQPAHQRFYLLTACLVCQIPGLPDRALNSAAEENVYFVVRRLLPKPGIAANYSVSNVDPTTCDEYAFVTSGLASGWRQVTSALVPEAGEEQLPLFPVSFTETDGRNRNLFSALVPVGKRETYLGAAALPASGPVPNPDLPDSDPRVAFLHAQVVEPWKNLVQRALAVLLLIKPPPPPTTIPPTPPPTPPTDLQISDAVCAVREQIQTVSWYLLLDFAKYLQNDLPNVWKAVTDPGAASQLSDAEQALLGWLSSLTIGGDVHLTTGVTGNAAGIVGNAPDGVSPSLRDALKAITAFETGLETTTDSYKRTTAPRPASSRWPTFLFPLSDPRFNSPTTTVPQFSQQVDPLTPLVAKALPAPPAQPATAVPLSALTPLDARIGWFVIRCVYERPHCGPLDPPVVSAPTPPFQMAAYFDPDAPARPLRIALPLDTSPAGLRKYDKNTAFMISDVLCNQLSGLNSLTLGDLVLSVLPWPFHKDLSVSSGGDGSCPPGIGSMCTFSLPIITICAMILLLILVKLLDIALFWMAFFRICLPLPNFKGKD
jgi:hypothetical protein